MKSNAGRKQGKKKKELCPNYTSHTVYTVYLVYYFAVSNQNMYVFYYFVMTGNNSIYAQTDINQTLKLVPTEL